MQSVPARGFLRSLCLSVFYKIQLPLFRLLLALPDVLTCEVGSGTSLSSRVDYKPQSTSLLFLQFAGCVSASLLYPINKLNNKGKKISWWQVSGTLWCVFCLLLPSFLLLSVPEGGSLGEKGLCRVSLKHSRGCQGAQRTYG